MKRFLIVILCLAVIVMVSACANEEKGIDPALVQLRLDYKKETKRIRVEMLDLQNQIVQGNSLLDEEREPLDIGTEEVLRDTIEDAEKILDDIPKIPSMSQRPEEMENIVEDLKMISFSEMTEQLQFAMDMYSRSLDDKDEEQKKDRAPVITMTELRDGVYLSLMLGSYRGESEGLGTCYKIALEGSELVVSGSWSYREDPNSLDHDARLVNDVYRFPVTGATQYVQTGGDMVVPYDSPQELVDTVQHDMDTNNGVALVIAVQNGTVTSVSTAS